MEVVVTTGDARKAPVKLSPPTLHTKPKISTIRMPFLSPNQLCQSTEGLPNNSCKILHGKY